MTRTARVREDGYTLIELLVTLTLLSFITLAIGSGLHFGTRVWEGTEDGVQTADRADNAQALLRSLLTSAVPVTKGEYVDFEGDPFHVTFEAPAPNALRAAGLVHIDITTVDSDSGRAIHIAFKSTKATNDREIALPTDTTTLRIAYLDASDSVPVWLDRWHDRDRLPEAIRIEGDDDASRQSWPEFVAKFVIGQRPDCAFDPVSLDCRRPQS
jgi:general secretion pathway protein J